MIQSEDLQRLKKLNEVTRICAKKTDECSRKIIETLMEQINMLQKQKKYLQKKIREIYNDTKTKKVSSPSSSN